MTAIGADRPGIVAALAEALRDLGGNLEDISSTILRGHFAMMLVVDAPEGVSPEAVREALARAAAPLGVSVEVRDVEEGGPAPAATHVLTVSGADRPGIVARMARLLADRGGDITDLSCRRTEDDRPVYVMVAEVALPPAADPEEVAREVAAAAAELSVDASLRPIAAETL